MANLDLRNRRTRVLAAGVGIALMLAAMPVVAIATAPAPNFLCITANGQVSRAVFGAAHCKATETAVPIGGGGATGPAGPAGASGTTGPKGDTGTRGPTGPTGPAGAVGPAGPAGAAGTAGLAGPAGDTGADGTAGPAGPAGDTGSTGATGAPGVPGPKGDPGAGSLASLNDLAGVACAIGSNAGIVVVSTDAVTGVITLRCSEPALTVVPGSGRIVSTPAGIDCNAGSGTCHAFFAPGTAITLTWSGTDGFSANGVWSAAQLVTGWTGCTMTADPNVCTLSMPGSDRTATATLEPLVALTVIAGMYVQPGGGSQVCSYATIGPPGTMVGVGGCGGAMTLNYRLGAVVTVVPTAGWGMTGCDTWDATAGVCTVTMGATRMVSTVAPPH